jgi:branched-chain amino acid transport system permease protein
MIVLDAIVNGFIVGGTYALIAVGLNLQYGVVKVLNVAHGEFVMIGAFVTYWLFTLFGINPLLSLVISGPITFLIGILAYKILIPHLRKSSESMAVFEANSMLITFGLLYVLQNLASMLWGSNMRGYSFLNFTVKFLGLEFEANRLIALLFAAVIILVFYIFIFRTSIGRAIRAAAQNGPVAQLLGVNTEVVLLLCFGLGAMLAGLAGSLISMTSQITPVMGFENLITALVVVVLGGAGNILGGAIGAVILGLVTSVVMYINPGLSIVVSYLILAVLLIVRPKGILVSK